jgi:ABC-type glutathione transport system ATPase component
VSTYFYQQILTHIASEVDSDSNNHDSGSDSDDEEERVPPHDPNKQDRPKLPIYHPGFKLTENVTQDILRVFISYITAAMQDGYSDKEAEHLRNEVVRSKTIKYQTAMKLAVAGDTGAGKSALLNSILGVINLNIEVCTTL